MSIGSGILTIPSLASANMMSSGSIRTPETVISTCTAYGLLAAPAPTVDVPLE